MARTFTVEGRGDFPTDMLRRDRCRPADAESIARMEATYENGGDTRLRRITLDTDEDFVTDGRWRSFGWPVVEGGDENVARPYRVMASVHPKTGAKTEAAVPIGIDRLDVDGPIMGRLGDAVRDLAAMEPRLKGQEPYLYNALIGVFACVRWRMEDAFRSGGRVDDVSTKISWTADFDVQIEIS